MPCRSFLPRWPAACATCATGNGRPKAAWPAPIATCPCRWFWPARSPWCWRSPSSHLIPTEFPGRLIGAGMIVLFGFLFVTVSSRITGVIGSSSNPISGMTIATLLLTCLIFVLLGWIGPEYRLTALSIAGIVCIASSNGGTTSQDLEDGFPGGRDPVEAADLDPGRCPDIGRVHGRHAAALNRAYTTVSERSRPICPTVKAPPAEIKGTEVGPDGKSYGVWWVTNPQPGVLPGKYLVDESGQARYLIDSGIGGRLTKTDRRARRSRSSIRPSLGCSRR